VRTTRVWRRVLGVEHTVIEWVDLEPSGRGGEVLVAQVRPKAGETVPHVQAVVYTRQSLDRTGDGLAVARQQEDCPKLCRDRGWAVAQIVTDNDVSASNGKPRSGFVQVLGMVDARAVDVVVVWAVDRLVRKLADLEEVIERCERAGVRLATVSGDVACPPTPVGCRPHPGLRSPR
jgi:predicted site-specific integrase-resolvase